MSIRRRVILMGLYERVDRAGATGADRSVLRPFGSGESAQRTDTDHGELHTGSAVLGEALAHA